MPRLEPGFHKLISWLKIFLLPVDNLRIILWNGIEIEKQQGTFAEKKYFMQRQLEILFYSAASTFVEFLAKPIFFHFFFGNACRIHVENERPSAAAMKTKKNV